MSLFNKFRKAQQEHYTFHNFDFKIQALFLQYVTTLERERV